MKFKFLIFFLAFAQSGFCQTETPTYNRADSLRGSITPERAWWDVLRYDISVEPDYE